MEDRERINKMVMEGKISAGQAELLLVALKESDERRDKIFNQIASQKKKRARIIWVFLGVLAIVALILGRLLLSVAVQPRVERSTQKALYYLNQAGVYLARGNYPEAIKYCKKGTEEAPKLPLGYSLLGISYRLMSMQGQDNTAKESAAFKKAEELFTETSKKEVAVNGAVLFFTLIFFLLICAIVSVVLLLYYNRLVINEERANEAWAKIAAQYQRKLSLVPALLEAVKNYTKHEADTFYKVSEARNKAQGLIGEVGGIASLQSEQLDKIAGSQADLSSGLARLSAIAEQYPDLKANANFLAVQTQLEDTENRIAEARVAYNVQIRNFNSVLRYFPANLVAASFGMQEKRYFETEEKPA